MATEGNAAVVSSSGPRPQDDPQGCRAIFLRPRAPGSPLVPFASPRRREPELLRRVLAPPVDELGAVWGPRLCSWDPLHSAGLRRVFVRVRGALHVAFGDDDGRDAPAPRVGARSEQLVAAAVRRDDEGDAGLVQA